MEDVLKGRGDAFRAVVLKNAKPEDYGYRRADYDAIQALK